MLCPNCRHESRPAAKFCTRCRTRLPRACPECGAECEPEDRFCGECGAELPAGAAAPVSAAPALPPPEEPAPRLEQQFARMEAALTSAVREQLLSLPEGETRIVTLLFADMSSSVAATVGLRPEEAANQVNRLLKAMVDALMKYEGRVDRFLGDGVLAVFGAPQTHENDPERAIWAALEIRKAARALGLEVTAGINTGEVYLGGIGSEQHQEVTVMGPVVNLAARLQGQAEPGQVLVGEATYRQSRGAFEFAPLSLTLKGIAEPVTAYAVQRPRPHPEKARGIEGLHAELVGRQKEWAALIDAVDALVRERRGQIVTISGEAGIGKTRLVAELKERVTRDEWEVTRKDGPDSSLVTRHPSLLWLEGRCISMGQSVSFWPFIDMLRTYLGITGEDTEQRIADRLVRQLTRLFGQDAEGIIPSLGQMLSVRLEERYQERLRQATPEQIRRQILLRMRDFFVALARQRPLAVILEDLHWADDLSLDLLWALMDELVAAPLLLVCVYRPEREWTHPSGAGTPCWRIDSAASSKHLERYTPLHLKPLTQQEAGQMVESLLAIPDLPARARTALLENTEGNPFFVEEVVRLLIECGAFYQEGGHWKAREPGPAAGESATLRPGAGQVLAGGAADEGELLVPDTVRSVILARIDRLQTEAKRVLQCAAVIGRVFQRRLLEHLSGQNEALEASLAELERHELVYKERTVPELEYAFKHALTQETAYEGILTRHRKGFHERVGAAIEALYQEQIGEYYELLAFHYSRSDNRQKAIEYLSKAGQKAAARGANQEARRCYAQALELAEGSGEYDAILAHRARLSLDLFLGREAAADYERLLQRARQSGNREQELASLLGLARTYYVLSLDGEEPKAPSRSREIADSAYALARALDDKAGMARALIAMTWLRDFSAVDKDQAAAQAAEALALGREIGDEALIFDSRLALLRAGRSDPEAETSGDDLRERLAATHDLNRLNELYFFLMWAHIVRGEFEKAVESCDAGIKLAGEMGVAPVQYPTLKSIALLKLGRYGEAWEALQGEVADEAHPFGAAMKALGASLYFQELMADERAAEIARSVIDQARHLRRAWMENAARIVLARALVRTGQRVEPELAQLHQVYEAMGAMIPFETMGEIHLAEGRRAEALDQAERLAGQAEEQGWKPAALTALELKLRILLRQEQPAAALSLADELLSMAEVMHALPMLWRIRAARAQALAMLGNPEAAVPEYQAAASLIRALADTIGDGELRHGFLSHPEVALILAAAQPEKGKE